MGCLFHYVKQTRLQMAKLGLYSNEYIELSNLLLENLTKAHFEYNNDSNIISNISSEIKDKSKKHKEFIIMIDKLQN